MKESDQSLGNLVSVEKEKANTCDNNRILCFSLIIDIILKLSMLARTNI